MHDRIKVEGRVGNLGDAVQISQTGDGKVEVVAHIPFSGRYLKYLYVSDPLAAGLAHRIFGTGQFTDMGYVACRTKKFLKKQQLRDWLRVVSAGRGVYELRFYNIVSEEAEEEEE